MRGDGEEATHIAGGVSVTVRGCRHALVHAGTRTHDPPTHIHTHTHTHGRHGTHRKFRPPGTLVPVAGAMLGSQPSMSKLMCRGYSVCDTWVDGWVNN